MVRIVLQWFMWFLWSSVVAAIPHVMATDNNLHIDDCQIEAMAYC